MTNEYKYVPVEPTDEMLCAAFNALSDLFIDDAHVVYKAMLAAAPEQPSPAEPLDREAIRNEVLEEAARYVEENSQHRFALDDRADGIRAMKYQPAQLSGNSGELPRDSQAEVSDTEMLDFLINDGDTVCELKNGRFEYYSYGMGRYDGESPREAIKAAMRADREDK